MKKQKLMQAISLASSAGLLGMIIDYVYQYYSLDDAYSLQCRAIHNVLILLVLGIVKYALNAKNTFVETYSAFIINIPLIVIITEYSLVESPTSFRISPA